MNQMLWVGIGGLVGSIARFKLSGLVLRHTADGKFPWGTFVVNVSGCLIAGILCGLAEKYEFFTPNVRLFLFTGLLGGFTTFSAFGVETIYLVQRHELGLAALNVAGSVVLGLGALWMGLNAVS